MAIIHQDWVIDAMSEEAHDASDREDVLRLLQALADPLRLQILEHLMGGPAPVAELVAITGAAQPKVSNHLAILRERGLIHGTRQGRQIVYELRDVAIAQLIESLVGAAGPGSHVTHRTAPVLAARTCYDHLAGRYGVALFDALVDAGALIRPQQTLTTPTRGGGSVAVGAQAGEMFGKLGIDLAALGRERRQLATCCIDWTERRQHLGGALGAALWARLIERGWAVKQPGSRAVIMTDEGKRSLRSLLGIDVDDVASGG